MLSSNKLKEFCGPYKGCDTYFRPLVCKGDIRKIGIFIVGINPATPIKTNVLPDEYNKMLTDYQKFDEYYVSLRKELGKKRKYSPTRLGIDSLVQRLAEIPLIKSKKIAIAETNVVPYPTKDYSELKALEKENPELIMKAKSIFLKLLDSIRPKIIIIHSKTAFDEFMESVKQSYDISYGLNYKSKSIEALETSAELLTIPYSSDERGTVLACRHLMYFGKDGNSYAPFLARGVSRTLCKVQIDVK